MPGPAAGRAARHATGLLPRHLAAIMMARAATTARTMRRRGQGANMAPTQRANVRAAHRTGERPSIDTETHANKRGFYGDAGIVRFTPGSAGHPRIHVTRRGTNGGGCFLGELRVYPFLLKPAR